MNELANRSRGVVKVKRVKTKVAFLGCQCRANTTAADDTASVVGENLPGEAMADVFGDANPAPATFG